MQFEDAKMNFLSAARYGVEAQFNWFGGEPVSATDLVLEKLLPMAREGLQTRGIDKADVDRYLDVVEQRVGARTCGARWIVKSLNSMRDKGSSGERLNALTAGMLSRQEEGKPVADWDLCELKEGGDWHRSVTRVEQCMTTDMFTVQQDDALDLVASLMEWERIRHVPVEDSEGFLVGLVGYRSLLRLMARGSYVEKGVRTAVSSVMNPAPTTVSPKTSTLAAIDLMREHKIGCLPVVKDRRLVGMITERDFMDVASELLRKQIQPD
jgi:CBS domain-containing protein